MSNRSRGGHDLVITSDEQQLRFALAWDSARPPVEPLELSPARLDEVVRNADVPRVYDSLDAGMGLSRRVPGTPNGYAYALPGYTRAPGGIFCPAGALQEIILPPTSGAGSWAPVPIGCSARFQIPGASYIYLGTQGPQILLLSLDGASAGIAHTFPAGWSTAAMAVFNNRLYCIGGGGLAYLDGATGNWSAPNAAIQGADLVVVNWRPLGVPTQVLVRIAADYNYCSLRWCPITADPMDPTKWSAPVRVGEAGSLDARYRATKLVAAPQHVYTLTPDGIYDMDELGARTFNIAPWIGEGIDNYNGFWGLHIGDGLYYNHAQGLTFVPTTGETQYRPEWAHPGWGLPYEGPVRGMVMTGTLHDGWGMAGMWGATESYVLAGRREPQAASGGATHIWHGAEAVVPGSVQHMRVWTLEWASGQPRLLLTTTTGGPTPTIRAFWQSLPKTGSPIQEMLWGGGFQPAAASSLFLPADPYERPSAIKSLLQFELITENMDLGSDYVKVYASSDTSPARALQGQAEEGPYTRLMPLEVTEGRYVSTRVDLVGHPILRSIDARAALGIELREARTYRVILSRESANGTATRENRDPEQRLWDLQALLGRIVTIDDGTSGGEPLRARVLQVMAGERRRLGTPAHGETWAVVVPMVVSLLDHPFRYDRAAQYDTDRTWR